MTLMYSNPIIEKGGFISAHWDGTSETEGDQKTNQSHHPMYSYNRNPTRGKCVYSGNPLPKGFFCQSLLRTLFFLLVNLVFWVV